MIGKELQNLMMVQKGENGGRKFFLMTKINMLKMLHKCVYNVKIQMYIERKFYITHIQYYHPEITTDYIFYIFLVLFHGIS